MMWWIDNMFCLENDIFNPFCVTHVFPVQVSQVHQEKEDHLVNQDSQEKEDRKDLLVKKVKQVH